MPTLALTPYTQTILQQLFGRFGYQGRAVSLRLSYPAEVRQDVFDYIEIFCNPKRTQVRNGMLSPVEFERQQEMRTEGV